MFETLNGSRKAFGILISVNFYRSKFFFCFSSNIKKKLRITNIKGIKVGLAAGHAHFLNFTAQHAFWVCFLVQRHSCAKKSLIYKYCRKQVHVNHGDYADVYWCGTVHFSKTAKRYFCQYFPVVLSVVTYFCGLMLENIHCTRKRPQHGGDLSHLPPTTTFYVGWCCQGSVLITKHAL